MQRRAEPELMDAPAQVQAYATADFAESNQAFVDRFVASAAADPPGALIDLGCGPGDICLRLARALPEWRILGLDAGPNMLAWAARSVAAAGLSDRIALLEGRLPCALPDGITAIVSNSLLHHLPDPFSLWRTIADRVGCRVQVMDLHRPDSIDEVEALVATHAADAPDVLANDFRNSLRAAYTADEVKAQLRECGLDQLTVTRPSDRHWNVSGRIGDPGGRSFPTEQSSGKPAGSHAS